MAFTITHDRARNRVVPTLCCDACQWPVMAQGYVLWGREFPNGSGEIVPTTSVVPPVEGAPPPLISVMAACDDECRDWLLAVRGERCGLSPASMSVEEYIARLAAGLLIDPPAVLIRLNREQDMPVH